MRQCLQVYLSYYRSFSLQTVQKGLSMLMTVQMAITVFRRLSLIQEAMKESLISHGMTVLVKKARYIWRKKLQRLINLMRMDFRWMFSISHMQMVSPCSIQTVIVNIIRAVILIKLQYRALNRVKNMFTGSETVIHILIYMILNLREILMTGVFIIQATLSLIIHTAVQVPL